jgi:ATP-dependent DNA ligase
MATRINLPDYCDFKLCSGGSLADADKFLDDTEYVAEEKYDGIRIHIHIDGNDSKAYTRVRGKNSGTYGDATAKLSHIVKELVKAFPAGTVLDGEIVLPVDCGVVSKSNLVSSAMADPKLYGKVEFICFDILYLNYKDVMGFELTARRDHLEIAMERLSDIKYVQLSAVEEYNIRAFLDDIWDRNGEGIILKPKGSLYVTKGRKGWIKVKSKRNYDVVFMGVEEAKQESVKKGASKATKTKFADMIGAIVFGQYIDGKLIQIGTVSGMDDATRADITKNHAKYTKQQCVFEIEGQERMPGTNAVRHPVFKHFRDDKKAKDCVYRSDES